MSNKKNDRTDEPLDEELDDTEELQPVVHKSARPAKLKAPMGRETKVGLVVIVALLFIFSLVLIKRLMGPPSADIAGDSATTADSSETTTDDGGAVKGGATEPTGATKSTLENRTALDSKVPFGDKPNVMQAKTEKRAAGDTWSNGNSSFAKNAKTGDSQSAWGGAGTAYGAKSNSAFPTTAATSSTSANSTRTMNAAQTPDTYGQLNKMADTGRSALAEVNGNGAASATQGNVNAAKQGLMQSGTSRMTADVVADEMNTSPVFPRKDISAANSAYGSQPPVNDVGRSKPAYGDVSPPAYDTQPRSAYGALPDASTTNTSTTKNSATKNATTDDAQDNRNAVASDPRMAFDRIDTSPAKSGAAKSGAAKSEGGMSKTAASNTAESSNLGSSATTGSNAASSTSASNPFNSRGFNSPAPATSPLGTGNAARSNSAANTSPSFPTNATPSASSNAALSKSDSSRGNAMTKLSPRSTEAPAYGAFQDDTDALNTASDVRLQPAPAADKIARALDTSARVNERSSIPATAGYPTYRVKANDTYWTISERVYGTGSYFKALYEHNRLRSADADRLSAGVELQTPDAATLERLYSDLSPKVERASAINSTNNSRNNSAANPTTSSIAKRPADEVGRSYVVEEGDTLLEIARRELGKPTRWAEIYQLNRDRSGIDLDYLRPGTELILPSDSRGSLR